MFGVLSIYNFGLLTSSPDFAFDFPSIYKELGTKLGTYFKTSGFTSLQSVLFKLTVSNDKLEFDVCRLAEFPPKFEI